jgi:hypothetical protein
MRAFVTVGRGVKATNTETVLVCSDFAFAIAALRGIAADPELLARPDGGRGADPSEADRRDGEDRAPRQRGSGR